MERQGDRVQGARDEVRPRTDCLERGREGVAGGTLAVEPNREPARLAQGANELIRPVRLERARRIVEENAHSAELGQLLRLLDEIFGLAGVARPVDEAGIELALGVRDRLAGLAQVGNVVEGVMQPEDVDAALGCGRDEAAGEVRADRSGADQESPSQCHRERRLGARLECADPLPGALDTTPNRAVEDPAAGDLQVGEAGCVQGLGQPKQVRRRHPARERLLGQQPDRRVDERGHLDPGA